MFNAEEDQEEEEAPETKISRKENYKSTTIRKQGKPELQIEVRFWLIATGS